jgi:hypothetical protein
MYEVEYVGYVVDEHGLKLQPIELDKRCIKKPNSSTFQKTGETKYLTSFLKLAAYFREHLDKYANMTAPLHGLIKSYKKIGYKMQSLEWAQHLISSKLKSLTAPKFIG